MSITMFSSLGAISVKLPMWVQTERGKKEWFLVGLNTNESDIIVEFFFVFFFRLFSNFGQHHFWCSFSTIYVSFHLEHKTLVTSNNAAIITPKAKPAFDLICCTGPYSFSLTLGFVQRKLPWNEWQCSDRPFSPSFPHLLFNLQQTWGYSTHNVPSLPKKYCFPKTLQSQRQNISM